MKKKCRTDKFEESTKYKWQSFTRHQWQEDFTCLRCGKLRNPLAGLKMFRPIIVLDKSTGTVVLLPIEGEQQ